MGRQQIFETVFCGYTLNDSVGFAYTELNNGALIKTTDAWINYDIISIPDNSYNSIKQIEFKDQTEGFAVLQDQGILLRTEDVGENWFYDSIGYNYYVNNIKFLDSLRGFLSANGIILKSTDGGDSWYETAITDASGANFSKFSFPSTDTLYVIATNSDNNVFRSVDGGENWGPVPLNCTSGLRSIEFFNNEKGLVFGDGGMIFTSDSTITTYIDDIDGINESFEPRVFPNPAANYINIDLRRVKGGMALRIEVSSINGVHQNTILVNGSPDNIKYDCSTLRPGVYLLGFYIRNKLLGTRKFIKR